MQAVTNRVIVFQLVLGAVLFGICCSSLMNAFLYILCVALVVAVKSLDQVKITDFGLAKVLEHDQRQVYGSGGKVEFSS